MVGQRFANAARAVKVFVCALFFFTGAAAQAPEITPVKTADPNYRVGIGDVLTVMVPKNALLSTDTVRVNNNGAIRLPMIDDEIQAKCLTESELSARITEKYKRYLLNPQVYVTVKEFNAHPVAVVGAVNAPGRFQLQRPVRLLELITFVNGINPNAGRSVQVIRSSDAQACAVKPDDEAGSGDEIINLPLAEMMKGGETANPFIYAGDIVRVAEAEQAFVVGNVRRGATINLNEPVTLSKAIAMAGGATDDAQIKKISILRQPADSLSKTEMIVNLKDINERKIEDVLLQPNDIVDVPGPSGTKKFFKDLFRSIVPVFTRAPVLIP